ncbi:MAG: ATP-binding protein, partial [Phycisphaerales bacterium]|nr:ATP-binding protein [Phycisphaerales bacterium]
LASACTTVVRDSIADDQLINVDATLMAQAIGNVLRNAVESMESVPEPGRIITVESRILRRLRIDGDRHPTLSIAISDRGCGVPEELVSRLFNPFFTTRPTGTGLGLAIAHRVVDAHGGDIVVTSREGGGSVFEVHIPIESSCEA